MNIDEIVNELVERYNLSTTQEVALLREYIEGDLKDVPTEVGLQRSDDIITEAFNMNSDPLIYALEDYMENYFPESE